MQDNKYEKHTYIIEFANLPTNKWRELLEWAVERSNIVEFVVGKKGHHPALEPHKNDLIKVFSSRWRWGAKQLSKTTYAWFILSNELKKFLLSVPYILDWLGDLPEDPTFYRNNEVILWTTSHEQLAFPRFTNEEAEVFRARGFPLETIEDDLPPHPLPEE